MGQGKNVWLIWDVNRFKNPYRAVTWVDFKLITLCNVCRIATAIHALQTKTVGRRR